MRVSLSPTLRAPAEARRFVTDQRRASTVGPSADDLSLVVSELVTNAVTAGASAVDVEVLASGGAFELRVHDDAAGWPQARDAAADSLGGRGLAIVDRLSHSWTVDRLPAGKCVTATWGAPVRS